MRVANAGGKANIVFGQPLRRRQPSAMKTSFLKSQVNFHRRVDPLLAWAVVIAMMCCGATVRGGEEAAKRPVAEPPSGTTDQPGTAASAAAAQPIQQNVASQPSAEALSPVTMAVLKMADAGVSTPVIKTYVEGLLSTDPLTGADIIALKKHNVADEVVTTLLKQGAKTQALKAQLKNEAVARALAARNARFGGMDPESYEYFQYNYLRPRTLASAYRGLYRGFSPYYGPWGSYPYYGSPGFGYRNYGRPPY
jgi:hypothetical protein